MDAAVARRIALHGHAGQRNRGGAPLVSHVERVAAVGPEARAVAFLHDVLERTDTPAEALSSQGLTAVETSALWLLTRAPGEPYRHHVERIARAEGPEDGLARAVKIADLDDHLARPAAPGDPPYGWARAQITAAMCRQDEPALA
jgi:hypothetical protein